MNSPSPKSLTDVYEFSDWLKRYYTGSGRKAILITPVQSGLIKAEELEGGPVSAKSHETQ